MTIYDPTRPLDFQSADFSLRLGVGTGGRWNAGYRSSFDLDVDNIPSLVWPPSVALIFQAIESTVSLVSTDAADTLLGTGGRRILLTGLDGNFNSISEILEMDGLTPVISILSYLRINSAVVLNVGTANQNVGDISISSVGTTDLMAFIGTGLGKHLSPVITAPNNLWLGITNFWAEVAGDDTLEVLFQSRHVGDSWRSIVAIIVPNAGNVGRNWNETSPVMIQPTSDVRIVANKIGEGQATSCSVGYNFFTIDSREVPLTDDLANI